VATLGGVLVYAALGTPFSVFLFSTYFRGVPDELIEAGIVDGLGYFGVLWRLVVPIALPAIATVTVLQFIQIWDDLLVGLFFIQNTSDAPITVGLAVLAAGSTTSIPELMAGSIISALPAMLVYVGFPALPREGPHDGHRPMTKTTEATKETYLMADITFDQVTKIFADKIRAVDELSLHVADGEFMVLVGPSGCGKTTALRMLAGLEDITSGTLSIGGAVVNNVLPKDRDVAMVFQNYALYPHMTVAQNMGFALKIRGVSKVRDQAKVTKRRRSCDSPTISTAVPRRSRVGSVSASPWVVPSCEAPRRFSWTSPSPTSTPNCASRCALEIARIQRLLGVATVYVTHDQIEAMTMGDRVAVMRGGKLQQVDAPGPLRPPRQRLRRRLRGITTHEPLASQPRERE
jgi:ABC-type nitrate/sulfonate/bicarbonate transport system ATPase subunit